MILSCTCVDRFIGGLFVTITLPVSITDILLHLNNYHDPARQKWVVRILWMVSAPTCLWVLAFFLIGGGLVVEIKRCTVCSAPFMPWSRGCH